MYVKRKHYIKDLLKISLVIAALSPIAMTTHVSADQNQNGYYIPSPLPSNDTSSNVIDQGADSQYNPNQSNLLPILGKKPNNVGFDILYGSTRGPFKYLGEISPYQGKNDQGLRQMPTTKIGNYYRGWGYSGDSKKVPSYSDGTNEKDLHWTAMISGMGGQGDNIIAVVMAGIYHLSNSIMDFMIELSGFDVQSIAQTFSDTGTPDKLAQIFLVSDSGISPLFMLAIAAFMLGLIGLGFRFMRGRASPKTILQEFGYMFLAMIFVALATNQTSLMNLSKTGQALGNSFANSVVMSTSKNLNLFKTDNGDSNRSNIITQKSILKSNYINAWIERETGYSVNSLDTSSFASAKVLKDIQSKLAYEDSKHKVSRFADSDAFQLKTGDDAKVDNLGYYLYASYSNVYISRWNYKMMPWIPGDNPTIRTTSQDYTRGLTVIDFLNAIATDSRTTDEQKTKAKTILKNLLNPSRNDGSFIFQLLLLTVLNVMLVIALVSIVIMMLIGKLILVIGVFVVIIFPILILIPQTRNFAKQLMNTYIIGFLKFAIGSTFFNVILALTVLLSSTGWTGTLVAMIVAFFVGKFGPKLVEQVEAQLNSIGRAMGGQLPINNVFNRRIQEAKERLGRRQVVDPNTGMLTDRHDNSRLNNVLNGIKRGKSVKDLAKLAVVKKGPESSRFAADSDTMLFNGNDYDEELVLDKNRDQEVPGKQESSGQGGTSYIDPNGKKYQSTFVNKDNISDTLSAKEATEEQKYQREKMRQDMFNQSTFEQNGKRVRTENLSNFGPLRTKQMINSNYEKNKSLDIMKSLKKTESDKNPIRAYKLRKLGSFATAATLTTVGIVSPSVAKVADAYIARENLNKAKRLSTAEKMMELSQSLAKAGEAVTINDIAQKQAENMVKKEDNKNLYDSKGNLNDKGKKKFNRYKKQALIEFKTVPKAQLEEIQDNLGKMRVKKTYVEQNKDDFDQVLENEQLKENKKQEEFKNNIPTRQEYKPIATNPLKKRTPVKLDDAKNSLNRNSLDEELINQEKALKEHQNNVGPKANEKPATKSVQTSGIDRNIKPEKKTQQPVKTQEPVKPKVETKPKTEVHNVQPEVPSKPQTQPREESKKIVKSQVLQVKPKTQQDLKKDSLKKANLNNNPKTQPIQTPKSNNIKLDRSNEGLQNKHANNIQHKTNNSSKSYKRDKMRGK